MDEAALAHTNNDMARWPMISMLGVAVGIAALLAIGVLAAAPLDH
jgi:hypothetical protein